MHGSRYWFLAMATIGEGHLRKRMVKDVYPFILARRLEEGFAE
jgi:hypothetical protein